MERANGVDQFYSRMIGGGGVELFVDQRGNPTTAYPHVHIVHHGSGQVEVTASKSSSDHRRVATLHNPSGNEVNAAIRDAQRYL